MAYCKDSITAASPSFSNVNEDQMTSDSLIDWYNFHNH